MALAARGAFVCVLPRRPSPTTTRPKQYLKQAFLSRRGGASLAVRAKDVDDYGALHSEKPAAPAPAKRDEWVGFGRDVSTVEKDEEEEEEVRSEQASLGVLNQIGVEESAALSLAKREGREGFGWNVSSTEKEEEEEEVQSEPASWDVLNQTSVELDSDKSYSALVMEVVGIGFTIWFTSRYLIFKENRDELFTKVTSIKKQILGSHDG